MTNLTFLPLLISFLPFTLNFKISSFASNTRGRRTVTPPASLQLNVPFIKPQRLEPHTLSPTISKPTSTDIRHSHRSPIRRLIEHSLKISTKQTVDQYINSTPKVLNYSRNSLSHLDDYLLSKHPEVRQLTSKLKEDKAKISIFKTPIKTIYLFLCWCTQQLYKIFWNIRPYLYVFLFVILSIVGLSIIFSFSIFSIIEWIIPWPILLYFKFITSWIFLGFLSSAGMGMGLHTFLLNLVPYTTQIALSSWDSEPNPTIFSIWLSVYPAAFLWGAGTAFGELSSYFLARAARASGQDSEWFKDIMALSSSTPKASNQSSKNSLYSSPSKSGPSSPLLLQANDHPFHPPNSLPSPSPLPPISPASSLAQSNQSNSAISSLGKKPVIKIIKRPLFRSESSPMVLPSPGQGDAGTSDIPQMFQSLDDLGETIDNKIPSSNRYQDFLKSQLVYLKQTCIRSVAQMGFTGILFLASIPNPLFDLAGVTAGYMMMDFWSFFLPTFFGKACIKAQVQVLFVILIFSPSTRRHIISIAGSIHPSLKRGLQKFILSEKTHLKLIPGSNPVSMTTSSSLLSLSFRIISNAILLYFLLQLIDNIVTMYLDEQAEAEIQMLKQKLRTPSVSRETTPTTNFLLLT